MATTPYKKAKNKAWRAFSKYIRTRDCLATTGETSQCRCVTCQKVVPYEEIQAGHAIGGSMMSIKFDEELVNGQCKSCNMGGGYGRRKMGYNSGRYADYSVWFINKYGKDKWEQKVLLSHESRKYSTPELEDIAQKYKEKYNSLSK